MPWELWIVLCKHWQYSNPWTMILNPYYPINPPHIFPNTSKLVAYLFPNIVSIEIVVTRGSQGVQASVMAPKVTTPLASFLPKILCPISNHPHEIHHPDSTILEVGYLWEVVVILLM